MVGSFYDPELDEGCAFEELISFHGGMDVQTTLPFGNQEEVRRVTRDRIRVLAAGGGYILSPTHNIQADTPPANILAVYSEAGSAAAVESLANS